MNAVGRLEMKVGWGEAAIEAGGEFEGSVEGAGEGFEGVVIGVEGDGSDGLGGVGEGPGGAFEEEAAAHGGWGFGVEGAEEAEELGAAVVGLAGEGVDGFWVVEVLGDGVFKLARVHGGSWRI